MKDSAINGAYERCWPGPLMGSLCGGKTDGGRYRFCWYPGGRQRDRLSLSRTKGYAETCLVILISCLIHSY